MYVCAYTVLRSRLAEEGGRKRHCRSCAFRLTSYFS